ncbi:MAG: hypothetical protein K5653_07340 [Clostridiales bacterium]|nr:hypothetical protein [Clostridiales bacterium]
MKRFFFVLALIMSLLSIPAFGQVEADINRPSVNADQFGLAVKAETALNKGQLSLNIPLMELKGKGYDLPISLSFYSGDVTCTTEASPIGLGWALMAGGVIAATVRGTDDIEDYTQDWKTDHHTDSNYLENNYRDPTGNFLDRIRWNAMPDEYTYSLPGHSGTIEMSVDNRTIKRTLFPDETYKIEFTDGGYCITADDGTKFYFNDAERRVTGSVPESTESTSWFLTRIETTKGGYFNFTYADEDYYDLSIIRDDAENYDIYHTKRIELIESDFGSVTFYAADRIDRGDIGQSIQADKKSKRINKIELRDENGNFIKGYELDNSGTFKLEDKKWEEPSTDWYNYRQMLSSVTQYDAAGNRLPPYRFSYDYRFSKSRLQYSLSDTDADGNFIPYDSWTAYTGTQVYVDLHGSISGSYPYCSIGDAPNASPSGFTSSSVEGDRQTADDFFCLNSICYPTGAIDAFTYEPHGYSKINGTNASPDYLTKIQGRRLASKTHSGADITRKTTYIYKLHDADYNTTDSSSGVLTNPSIHSATYYTPEYTGGMDWIGYGWVLRASRITSGKPFNSFMGPPVCYTEVEEVERDVFSDILFRKIHYFEPQIVSPPVNYFLTGSSNSQFFLQKIENIIYGKKSGYKHGMESCNNNDHTYIAYPVGEFCNVAYVVDKPLKEVFIGKEGYVRSIKKYSYDTRDDNMSRKYGYRIFSPNNSSYSMISKSEYITRRFRLDGITTTSYYYDGTKCDSICESYGINYSKGRTKSTGYSRSGVNSHDSRSSVYYYPDNTQDIMNGSSSPAIAAVKGLVEKNIIADPIKSVVYRNGETVGGECKDYQIVSDTSMPMLKSLYKLKNTSNNSMNAPSVSGNSINYHADLYKEGEVMTYDMYLNPEHVRLYDTQDRIYVWGYGGRFPIAVIDNMTYTTFQSSASLKSAIQQLEAYSRIENEGDCTNLRNLNTTIRSLLPPSAHITTYTYDPYFGMTSETDDSNLGAVYTYDTFGRLTAKYDENYRKIEEYNYHLKLQ